MVIAEIIRALGLTIVVELVVALGSRRFFGFGFPQRWWVIVVLMNCVTHPLAYVVVGRGVPWLLVEGAVVMFEAAVVKVFFARSSWVRALGFALTLNAASAGTGLLLYSFGS